MSLYENVAPDPKLTTLYAQREEAVSKALLRLLNAEEAEVKRMLGQWVSELEPSIVRDHVGALVGLTAADHVEIGTRPFIAVRARPIIMVLTRNGIPIVEGPAHEHR